MVADYQQKVAKAMVALGTVRRDGRLFYVSNGTLKSKGAVDHIVKRNGGKAMVCDCPDYATLRQINEQCRHILAVKEFIAQGEPMAKTAAIREKVKQKESPIAEKSAFHDDETIVVDGEETSDEVSLLPEVGDKPEWFRRLQQPVPKTLVKQREGWKVKGVMQYVDYIEWHTAVKLLNAAVGPNWSWNIIKLEFGERLLVCHGRLIVRIGDFFASHDGLGTGELEKGDMGIKAAESDALKRAATKFGLALELYDKEGDHVSSEQRTSAAPKAKAKPAPDPAEYAEPPAEEEEDWKARSVTDQITEKQVYFINNRLASGADIDDIDEYCKEQMGCYVEELGKKGASKFIDHLKELAGME